MEHYIPIKKASMYLEDRNGLSRTNRLFCFLKKFADEYDLDAQEAEEYQEEYIEEELDDDLDVEFDEDTDQYLDEVYLSGLCEIDSECIDDFFINQLSNEGFSPNLTLIKGTINGQPNTKKDKSRVFTAEVETDQVYINQADLDAISEKYGIPKRENFDKKHIKTIANIENEYDPDNYSYFLPDEEDEFEEYYKTENKSGNIDSKKPVRVRADHQAIREEVLGAALSVLANWPELCTNKSGSIEARRLQNAIDEKSPLFWKDTGEPPLKPEGVERLVSKWIKRYGQDV